jgi:hypothetical protein
MPSGKLGPSGGYAWVPPLPYSVSVCSLRRRARGPVSLTKQELRQCRQVLRTQIRIYRIAVTMPTTTSTERRKMLHSVKVAATKWIRSPTREQADRVLESLRSCDPNTNAVIHRKLTQADFQPRRCPR